MSHAQTKALFSCPSYKNTWLSTPTIQSYMVSNIMHHKLGPQLRCLVASSWKFNWHLGPCPHQKYAALTGSNWQISAKLTKAWLNHWHNFHHIDYEWDCVHTHIYKCEYIDTNEHTRAQKCSGPQPAINLDTGFPSYIQPICQQISYSEFLWT